MWGSFVSCAPVWNRRPAGCKPAAGCKLAPQRSFLFLRAGQHRELHRADLAVDIPRRPELAIHGEQIRYPDAEQPLIDLQETYRSLSARNLLEGYHDAQQALDQALNLFSLGYLSLEQRSIAENLYWAISRKIQKMARELDYFPEELEGIDAMLSDTYFCNFSLFQSMPDSWAIKQLFPIMPIHRLEEEPSRPAVLGDITCDSDGKVDAFIDRRDVKRTLLLHTFNGGDYYLGAFLLGAYQEILGDLHNLFGDTNAVHVRLGPAGDVILDSVIKGDTVREVLNYVQFSSDSLVAKLRRDVETALRESRLTYEESGALLKFYEEGLHGYTYLEDVHEQ